DAERAHSACFPRYAGAKQRLAEHTCAVRLAEHTCAVAAAAGKQTTIAIPAGGRGELLVAGRQYQNPVADEVLCSAYCDHLGLGCDLIFSLNNQGEGVCHDYVLRCDAAAGRKTGLNHALRVRWSGISAEGRFAPRIASMP